ncbi:MAG: hypothetical protein PHW69_03015 [Elusimicrobiaceae bacterium]|nr:hypothetical protein [Elusimicrobiaceae bacterium]
MKKTERYPAGAVRLEGEADADGGWDGIVSHYLETGVLRKQTCYRAGVKCGREQVFRADGTLEQEIFYRDGLPSGAAVFYYPDGKKQREIFFEAGRILSSAEYKPDGLPDTSGQHFKSADI